MHTPETQFSHSIRRPEEPERVEQLQRKLEEYHEKLDELSKFKHPDQIIVETILADGRGGLDTMLKIGLLSEVLESESGEINVSDFMQRVAEDPQYGKGLNLDARVFFKVVSNACGVIDLYCKGDPDAIGGVYGGTGLS